MTQHIKGSFDVKLAPLSGDNADWGGFGRMSIDKQYYGDLAATGRGQMIAVRTGVENSAGYVAIERVTGTLLGRKGTFVLQHDGIMNRGQRQLTVTIVPDSGSGKRQDKLAEERR